MSTYRVRVPITMYYYANFRIVDPSFDLGASLSRLNAHRIDGTLVGFVFLLEDVKVYLNKMLIEQYNTFQKNRH